MFKVNNTRVYLSGIVLLFSLFLLISLFLLDIPNANKDLVNILLGAVIGWTGNIISFYFGSVDKSKESL